MKIITKKSLDLLSSEPLHPLLLKVITRIVKLGAGVVHITPDHHVFVKLSTGISELRGALDMQKEGKEAGLRVVVRRAPKRGKYSLYTGLPDYQLYTLPIVKKEASTMSDAERLNIERNALVLKRVHAIKRDPVQLAHYRRLHRLHLLNPTAGGYSRPYPNFYGFLVATLHLELAASSVLGATGSPQASCSGVRLVPSSICPALGAVPPSLGYTLTITPSISPALNAGIALVKRAYIVHSARIIASAHFPRLASRSRPLIRLPIAA